MKYLGQTSYDHQGERPQSGVLLCNLGTPDAPYTTELRVYLKEFLSDPRVVEVPRLLWFVILYFIILPLRPSRSANLYKSVWTNEGAPLLVNCKAQVEGVRKRLQKKFGRDIPVTLGMRYGNPSIPSALSELTALNVRNIVVLPLYPQYCAATTGSTFDAIAKTMMRSRWVPELHFIGGYQQSSQYIMAIGETIKIHFKKNGKQKKIIFSYHGTPQKYLEKGDPYHCFCHQTTRLVREFVGLKEEDVLTTFQSRFGREPWLQPYTDKILEDLPSQGITSVAVLCPGFSSDCLETLEEIKVEARDIFTKAGGSEFHYIPALNSNPQHLDALTEIISRHLI
ncbi:MAG: ferrochelatase [Cellvibrionales bacterium TMED49]|nr:ferrochelatase [Porticoccaceae bacterium]OUU38318.1 MAG: ferrochelatase [Cellvibrionales bacterium TMED49]